MFRLPLIAAIALFLAAAAPVASAQTTPPPLPDTLQNLAKEGAQMRYLGREQGLDGWLVIQNGQEQFFYVTPDREAILMGILFDKTGKMITVRQVQNLQQGNDPTLDSLMATPEAEMNTDRLAELQKELQAQLAEKQKTSPAQQLFAAIEKANTITLGSADAPVVYAFLDPQCPHCHEFIKDIRKDYIEAGQIQLKVIPVGFRDETKAQAAVLLAAPDPQSVWFRHLDGDETALPVSSAVNRQAVEQNLAIMQEWKLDATPIVIYKTKSGEIKIIRGRPRNPVDLLNDLQ